MEITFGKNKGKDSRQVLIRDPAYVSWCFHQQAGTGPLRALIHAFDAHIRAFDAAPFTERCLGRTLSQKCTAVATRATVYVGSSGGLAADPYWWCDSCDPYGMGALRGRLREVRTYREAVRVVESNGGLKADYKALIGGMAEAKGLGRLAQKALDDFFGAS